MTFEQPSAPHHSAEARTPAARAARATPAASQPTHTASPSQGQPRRLDRRSVALPMGCSYTAAMQDDDDAASRALNWTAAVHCSYAGLTAVPTVLSGALYL